MDDKHPLLGGVMIHVEEDFQDMDHEVHRSYVII